MIRHRSRAGQKARRVSARRAFSRSRDTLFTYGTVSLRSICGANRLARRDELPTGADVQAASRRPISLGMREIVTTVHKIHTRETETIDEMRASNRA